MHQAAGNLLDILLFGADVALYQEADPVSSATHQHSLSHFQSSGDRGMDVLCLFVTEVTVLSVYVHPLDLTWDVIWKSI